MNYPKPQPPKAPLSISIPSKQKSSTEASSITESKSSTEQSSSESASTKSVSGISPKPTVKREFVLKPHLTDRPLRNNEKLQALRDILDNPTTKRPRRK
jgi:hypothetical protein